MKFLKYSFLLAMIALFSYSFTSFDPPAEAEKVKWLTWEEAAKLNETTPKKFFIDVYTDWCGWCKVMDKKTFSDPKVAAYLGEHFYAIKLDAESKDAIQHQGNTFEYRAIPESRRGGIHMLAYSLLDGKMSYPTVVTMNENFERIAISPGYKEADMMYNELQFAAEEHYLNTSFQEFMAGKKSGE